jgi:GAF domain-containing protein
MQFQINNSSPVLSYIRSQYLTKKDLDTRPELRGVWTAERTGLNVANIELLFPLLNRGNMVGILALGRKRTGKYSVDDANLVESIASQVAISLEKEHFQSELAKREKELSIINHLTRVITSSLNIQDVYDSFILGLRDGRH